MRVGQGFDFIVNAENADCIDTCERGIYTLIYTSGVARNSVPTLKKNLFNDF